MIKKLASILTLLKSKNIESDSSQNRAVRRSGGQSTVFVNGQEFPIENWSQSGLLFAANSDEPFKVGENIDVLIKFNLPYNILNIKHTGCVVRKDQTGEIAAQFQPMSSDIKRKFDRVIDSIIAEGFLPQAAI